MKGTIQPDHSPKNKYSLLFVGLPPLTPTMISGAEDTLQTAEMPDRTRASGGNREATEIVVTLPLHHEIEQAAMELWWRSAQDPVLPTYKLIGTLVFKTIGGNVARTFSLIGVFPTKRKLPDLEMVNEGEMNAIEWTLSVDDILPI